MDTSRSALGQFKQQAFVWSSIFSQRRQNVYGSEDLRYVESLRVDNLPNQRNLTTEEVIGWFVHNQCNHDVDRYMYREGHLSEFLALASLESLRNISSHQGTRLKALMDDRNDETVTRNTPSGSARPSLGPMSARGLYSELLKSRINLIDQINAERRLIYITGLDPACALSLAATASRFQASYLRDFIYKHLTCRTFIGIQTRTVGFCGFSLEFHLPYYARRRMLPTRHTDPRLRSGKSLRRSEEVIQLSLDSQNTTAERDCIHEAQVSIMVIGLDDWFWTAYCFSDVYFKSEEHTEQNHAFMHLPEESFRWTIRVLRQFTHVLSKTIDSWDTFKDGEIRYLNLPDSENLADATWGNLLAAIDKDVIELRDLRSSLQHKTELFENMTNSIVTHAAHAETIITRLQSQFIQALTVITIVRDSIGNLTSSIDGLFGPNFFQFYLPPTLASSIFSMQDSIFTNPKFKDWLFTLLGLFMATALLVLAVLTFNHPRISTWLLQVWASVTRVPTHLLQVFLSIRWASNRDGQLGQDPEEIEMDEQDDPDAPGAGQV
ncbi:hypothetical protein ONS96_014201 [Cadophora gregata f. sp. sojae]|nr:hypothetical protein ONS96_014201 [Cadophora gregata f. sp. sojae]